MTEISKELLQKFCLEDPSSKLEVLATPFTIDGFTYATNGHIMIRVPEVQDTVRAGKDHPRPAAILLNGHAGVSFVDRSFTIEVPSESVEPCECQDHDCPSCTCWVACKDCENGSVKKLERKELTIDGVRFDPWYIELIQSLPGFKFPDKVKAEPDPMAFTFDGGIGVLMPRRDFGDRIVYRFPKARAA